MRSPIRIGRSKSSIGQPLAEALKQPVLVDNRSGPSTNIGMEAAAKAAPDGYTLLMASNGIAMAKAEPGELVWLHFLSQEITRRVSAHDQRNPA